MALRKCARLLRLLRSGPVGKMNTIETLEFTPFLSAIKSPSIWNWLRSWWSKGTDEHRTTPASDPATYSPCNPEERLEAYKRLLEDALSIYVFRNGTAVYSAEIMSEADALYITPANIQTESGGSSILDFKEQLQGLFRQI